MSWNIATTVSPSKTYRLFLIGIISLGFGGIFATTAMTQTVGGLQWGEGARGSEVTGVTNLDPQAFGPENPLSSDPMKLEG